MNIFEFDSSVASFWPNNSVWRIPIFPSFLNYLFKIFLIKFYDICIILYTQFWTWCMPVGTFIPMPTKPLQGQLNAQFWETFWANFWCFSRLPIVTDFLNVMHPTLVSVFAVSILEVFADFILHFVDLFCNLNFF